MKKAYLKHDARGFFLANAETKEFLKLVNVGEEDEIDWDLVETQAKENGYKLVESED